MLDEEWMRDERTVLPVERMIGVFDGHRIVGTAASYPFELTLPGGAVVPAAGLAEVTVAPTHRRQGILRSMMREYHDEARSHGEVVGLLTASDTRIYPRFDYGASSSFINWTIDTDRAAFREEPTAPGRLVEVPKAEALPLVAAAYERVREVRAGSIARSDSWWTLMLSDFPSWKGGGPLHVVVHRDGDGQPDGYATYKMHNRTEQWVNRWEVEVTELLAVDHDVEAVLWRHLFDLDLVDRVCARMLPIDDPTRWRLAEPRQLLQQGPIDALWLALLDPARVLEARSFWVDSDLVIETTSQFEDSAAGRWRLVVADGSAGCEPTDGEPDVVLGADALATAVLGGVTVRTLAAAGRVEERSLGAIETLHQLLDAPRAPFCSTMF